MCSLFGLRFPGLLLPNYLFAANSNHPWKMKPEPSNYWQLSVQAAGIGKLVMGMPRAPRAACQARRGGGRIERSLADHAVRLAGLEVGASDTWVDLGEEVNRETPAGRKALAGFVTRCRHLKIALGTAA